MSWVDSAGELWTLTQACWNMAVRVWRVGCPHRCCCCWTSRWIKVNPVPPTCDFRFYRRRQEFVFLRKVEFFIRHIINHERPLGVFLLRDLCYRTVTVAKHKTINRCFYHLFFQRCEVKQTESQKTLFHKMTPFRQRGSFKNMFLWYLVVFASKDRITV